jgi:hypothetical protein
LKGIGVSIPFPLEARMARPMSGRKAQEWQRRLRRFQKSRQSINAFCRQEGVSPPSFYLWRKRLAQPPDRPEAVTEPPAGFRPVRLLPAAGLMVQLPGGTQLVVPMSDPESLRSVIEAVARVDAQRCRDTRPC